MKEDIKKELVEMLLGNEHINTVFFKEISIDGINNESFPTIVIQEDVDEATNKRFLYSEHEANLTFFVGFREDDMDVANEKRIELKESIKATLKKDPLLGGTVSYSTIIRSTPLTRHDNRLKVFRLVFYINYSA